MLFMKLVMPVEAVFTESSTPLSALSACAKPTFRSLTSACNLINIGGIKSAMLYFPNFSLIAVKNTLLIVPFLNSIKAAGSKYGYFTPERQLPPPFSTWRA